MAHQAEDLLRTTRPGPRLASSLHDSSPDSRTNKANSPHHIPITKHHHHQLSLFLRRTLASHNRHWKESSQGPTEAPRPSTKRLPIRSYTCFIITGATVVLLRSLPSYLTLTDYIVFVVVIWILSPMLIYGQYDLRYLYHMCLYQMEPTVYSSQKASHHTDASGKLGDANCNLK